MITSSAKSSLLTDVIIRDDEVVSIPRMRKVGIARQNAMVKNARAAVD
jgi:hypothetical protein